MAEPARKSLAGAVPEYNPPPQHKDLDDAIDACRKAVDIATEDDPDRAMYLCDLGYELRLRSDRSGSINDLNEAVDRNFKAIQLQPIDPRGLVMWWNMYGGVFRRRGEYNACQEDLNESVKAFENAFNLSPELPEIRATFLHNLGNALQTRT
jgi:tetratricopeptide (TPR) repeat protein